MLPFLSMAFCILWYVDVWVRLSRYIFHPCKLTGRGLLFFFKAVQTCYTKTADIAKQARIKRQNAAKNAEKLKD